MAEDNLTNIIQNLKDKMTNTGNSSNPIDNTGSSNDAFNITPDMIHNLANILNTNPPGSQNSSNTENSDTSAGNTSSSNFSNSLDLETIMKIKSMMDAFNKKDDPRSNLLYSLKPYLRESKQKKLDQYVNLFKITQVTNLFKNEKGDEN